MKKKIKIILLVIALLLTLCIAKEISIKPYKSEPSWDRRPMIMYEDEIYYYVDDKEEKFVSDIIFDGTIDSEVDASKIPFKNNQSNFGVNLNYRINKENNWIEVYLGQDRWMMFSKDINNK